MGAVCLSTLGLLVEIFLGASEQKLAIYLEFKGLLQIFAIMAGIKALVGLAFLGSIGLLFLFLGCALPDYNWWPFFVVIFYLLAPIPTLISKRSGDYGNGSSALKEVCAFFTTGLVLSAFALPVVLARATTLVNDQPVPVILWGSCALAFMSNIVMFLTILGFFMAFDNEDGFEYN